MRVDQSLRRDGSAFRYACALAFALVCEVCLAVFAPLAGAQGALAAASVPAPVAQAIPEARLAGQGVLRFWGFHVYDAQFFVGDAGYLPERPGAAPFALDVKYARHFEGKAIAKTSLDEFERLGAGSPAQREQWYEELLKVIPDVVDGQHLTGLFLPGQGLKLYSDGALLGFLQDPELAQAFFRIWLDPRTKAPELREKLLADAAPRR